MEYGKLICLIGKSGSGKSTIEKAIARNLGINRVVSTTTRPIRRNEIDGVDYHFISDNDYQTLIEEDRLLAPMTYHTKHGDWHYGINIDSIDLCDGENYICVIEPKGYKDLVAYHGRQNIVSILVHVNDKERLIRSLNRGTYEDVQEIIRRYHADVKDFDNALEEVDYVIVNNNIEKSIKLAMNVISEEL